MNIRNFIEQYLSREEAETFAEWAFGPDFKRIDLGHEGHIYWNKRHGFILTLKGEGKPHEDIPLMIELWKSCTECDE